MPPLVAQAHDAQRIDDRATRHARLGWHAEAAALFPPNGQRDGSHLLERGGCGTRGDIVAQKVVATLLVYFEVAYAHGVAHAVVRIHHVEQRAQRAQDDPVILALLGARRVAAQSRGAGAPTVLPAREELLSPRQRVRFAGPRLAVGEDGRTVPVERAAQHALDACGGVQFALCAVGP